MSRPPKAVKNPAASRIAKLKTVSKEQNIRFHRLTDLYILQSVLRRVHASEFGEILTLKGGMMLLSGDGKSVRPTKDIDLHTIESWNEKQVKDVIRAIVATPIEDNDGVVFDLSDLKVTPDWTDDQIGGMKVLFRGYLQQSKLDIHIDLGKKNPIFPQRLQSSIPGLLPEQAPVEMPMYTFESSLAEKTRATIHHGMNVSRMKDFFDIDHFSKTQEFDGAVMAAAMVRSCEFFKTDIPVFEQIGPWQLENIDAFRTKWTGFVTKPGLKLGLDECLVNIREFMKPVIDHIHGGEDPGYWRPGEGWIDRPTATPTLG